jgi:hypothetical protein
LSTWSLTRPLKCPSTPSAPRHHAPVPVARHQRAAPEQSSSSWAGSVPDLVQIQTAHNDLVKADSESSRVSGRGEGEGEVEGKETGLPVSSELSRTTLAVTDLQGPPSERTQSDKIRDLKSLAKQYARDQGSCDDTRISYLEYVESEAEADWTLARMIAG